MKFIQILKSTWQKVVEPPESVTQPDDRRQSRLLASLLVILIPFGFIMSFGYEIRKGEFLFFRSPEFIITLIALGLLVAAYFINRSGKYFLSAFLTITTITIATFIASIPDSDPEEVTLLYYLIFPVLMSSILLSITATSFFVLFIFFGMLAFGLNIPGVDTNLIPIYSVLLISLIILLGAEYRTLLERDRQATLIESEERFRTLVEHAPEAIVVYDSETKRFVDANKNALKLFGRPKAELFLLGLANVSPIFHIDDQPSHDVLYKKIDMAIRGEKPIFEWVFQSSTGKHIPCEVRLLLLPSREQKLIRGSITDITEKKQTEEHLMYIATHDLLTELPNRSLFIDRLKQAIFAAKRSDIRIAVLFLDIDNFKDVNDAFTHKFGDRLLKYVAKRLKNALRENDTIARNGEDEFIILIEGINDPADVIPVIDKIIKTISEPFTIDEKEIYITISIGISVFPMNGTTSQILLQNADTALYHAKGKGKNTFQFFSLAMEDKALERVSMGTKLRHALDRDEFILHYQPQLDIKTGKILGAEALIRWPHPEEGFIPPSDFIPLAEESGLILPIGEWVLKQACEQIKNWQEQGLSNLKVSVNISERQLRHPEILENIDRILSETEIEHDLLELELTENIILQNADNSRETLYGIKELGVNLAVDDFGTGYSTLSQLARFPFDILKIDRSFASRITIDGKDAVIVAGIISIAKNLGMKIIAEGVEEPDQFAFFRAHRCDMIQGWYFSPALPPDKFIELWLHNLEEPFY